MSHSEITNRLSRETSPYLLQHAHNPVDWYPWGPEALERARREGKPILLSIGYSACHWCHVMAHESFEDPATAQVMNELFVNIKVDREERPDLDKIYQTAHQLLTGRGGGWPLTLVLTPEDQTPFFAGTYFPRTPRYGMPAFADLLRRIETFYRTRSGEVNQQNAALLNALQSVNPAPLAGDVTLNGAPLEMARRQLESSFDARYGGFGGAPKFPHPPHIERLLRHWSQNRAAKDSEVHGGTNVAGGRMPGATEVDDQALTMASFTLQAMAKGGIYDQLGGGFCRYAVDEQWMIPHFEKMLYDNGLLLALYAQAWAATNDPLFKRIAMETAQWVMREMQSPEGGYYSSLDADSEGHEGKFYVWSQDEVRGLLDEQEYTAFARRFGLDRPPNFDVHGSTSVAGGRTLGATEGKWHLHVFADTGTIAHELKLSEKEVIKILDAARAKLHKAREQRVHPGRDEKILTSWNALMTEGMAAAGRLLNEPELLRSAERSLHFIKTTLWRDDRLLATYKDGRSHLTAYLDDHAYLLDAVLELLQVRWRTDDLNFAVQLAEVLLEHFEDKQHGGFYFTADDHERLIHRPKPLADDATPAGNGIAAYGLNRLGQLLGETRYLDAAERALKAGWADVTRAPYAHDSMLLALEEVLYPPQIIILRGEPAEMREWQSLCASGYAPRRLCFTISANEPHLPGALALRTPKDRPVAYVCEGNVCSAPVTELAGLELRLGGS
jgi:uncharacterized protein YyaL (SSP411 family)